MQQVVDKEDGSLCTTTGMIEAPIAILNARVVLYWSLTTTIGLLWILWFRTSRTFFRVFSEQYHSFFHFLSRRSSPYCCLLLSFALFGVVVRALLLGCYKHKPYKIKGELSWVIQKKSSINFSGYRTKATNYGRNLHIIYEASWQAVSLMVFVCQWASREPLYNW